METDLLGEVPLQQRVENRGAYPADPGTGPKGKTCGDCDRYCSVQGGSRRYPKCGMLEHRWTHGKGTDIKKSSPACRFFNYESNEPEPVWGQPGI